MSVHRGSLVVLDADGTIATYEWDLDGDGSTTFTFPYVTIENVLLLDARTLLQNAERLEPKNPDVLVGVSYLRNPIYEYNQRDARGQSLAQNTESIPSFIGTLPVTVRLLDPVTPGDRKQMARAAHDSIAAALFASSPRPSRL